MKLDEYPIVFPSTQIRSLTVNGILYQSTDGNLDYIDLENCYQHWFEREFHNLDGYWPPMDEATFRVRMKEHKEVAARDAFNEPPYITFYTVPQIRFEFETYEAVSEFRRCMYNLGGWHTYDLA